VPKKYDESFKRQAVEMVLHGGRRVKEVAAANNSGIPPLFGEEALKTVCFDSFILK
jgi:hypothetical protein